MSEGLRYVSPEYEEQLQRLAETLVTPDRYGKVEVLGEVALLDLVKLFDL